MYSTIFIIVVNDLDKCHGNSLALYKGPRPDDEGVEGDEVPLVEQ